MAINFYLLVAINIKLFIVDSMTLFEKWFFLGHHECLFWCLKNAF